LPFVAEQLEGKLASARTRVLFAGRAWTELDPSAVDTFAEAVTTMSVLREASPPAAGCRPALATFAAVIDPGVVGLPQPGARRGGSWSPGGGPRAVCFPVPRALTLETAEAVAAHGRWVSGITGAALRLRNLRAPRRPGGFRDEYDPRSSSICLQRQPTHRPPPALHRLRPTSRPQRHDDGVRLFAS